MPKDTATLRRWRAGSAVASTALLLAAFLFLHASTAQAQVAVVVSAQSPISQMSSDELKRVFEGKAQTVSGLTMVVGFEATAQDAFCKAVFGANALGVRKRWAQLVFQGEASAIPATLNDVDGAKKFIKSAPGAIAFLPLAEVDASFKVVKIDGAAPSDAAYKIK